MAGKKQQVSHTMHLCTQQFSNDYLLCAVIHPQLGLKSRMHRCALHHQVSCFSFISLAYNGIKLIR